MPSDAYLTFIKRVREINLASSIEAVLDWDQETYMPPKGAENRAQQAAFMAGVAHDRLVDEEVGKLLEKLEAEGDDDPVVATNVREMRRQYDRKTKLPKALVEEIAGTTTRAKSAWVKARKASDFGAFAPLLDKLLDLKRQVAERIGYDTEAYDALMDEFEPGARAADVQAVFDGLRKELVPIVQQIKDAPRQPDVSLLERNCAVEAQAAFGRRVAGDMGYDFEAGRLDIVTHPFCTGFSPSDVRITTRYSENYLPMALFGTMHEAGHALYEQGLMDEHAHTPMGQSISLGIHESQSRMWENLIGRSRPFWTHYYPALQEAFPVYKDVALDDWYFAINNVRPSYIRVEADEVTYGLHIMLRFEIERKMISGELATKDVPEYWNTQFQEYVGITPPDDAQGCLQDIHWSMGIMGYFPTYALGNLYASQFFVAARAALPELDAQVGRGELLPLREWLRENIHRHGRRYKAGELVERVTGAPLSHGPFVAYLREKYGPLYGF
jgi:carboxypeptidase Taq